MFTHPIRQLALPVHTVCASKPYHSLWASLNSGGCYWLRVWLVKGSFLPSPVPPAGEQCALFSESPHLTMHFRHYNPPQSGRLIIFNVHLFNFPHLPSTRIAQENHRPRPRYARTLISPSLIWHPQIFTLIIQSWFFTSATDSLLFITFFTG